MSTWQKCPVCEGIGSVGFSNCGVCGGAKIISEITGLPPNSVITSTSTGANFVIKAETHSYTYDKDGIFIDRL